MSFDGLDADCGVLASLCSIERAGTSRVPKW